jgi:hypothetical protein
MNKTCRKGSILRKGYTRHLKNKTVRVRSGCIKAQSQSGLKRSSVDKAIMTKKRRIERLIRKRFGTPKCKSGEVIREGYTRKSYVRKNGVHVSSSKVGPGCIKAVGLSKKRGMKGRQLFVLEKGTLTKFGYHTHNSEKERHEALKKAVKKVRPLSVYRKLNALYVLNKNKNPTIAKMYRKDADWVKTTNEYMNRDI